MSRASVRSALLESTDSPGVREGLVRTLDLDLVGPKPGGEHAEECLPEKERPSMWYLAGFLVPSDAPLEQRADDDADDDFEAEVPEATGLAEESAEERRAARKNYYPASMGLSFLVRPGVRDLRVTVTWGDYERSKATDIHGKEVPAWRRTPHSREITLSIGTETEGRRQRVPESRGLWLHVRERPISVETLAGEIQPGTRAVSVFLANHRTPAPKRRDADSAYAFQARIVVESETPFHPRPDMSARVDRHWDERVADLHYADTPVYATGHGISADWEVRDG